MDIQTTVNQMGGAGRLQVMVGTKVFLRVDENTMLFQFKGNRKMSWCRIYLNGLDLYDMKLEKRTKDGVKVIAEANNLYCEDLKPQFEKLTGLYLSL